MSNRPDRRERILYQLKYIGYDENNIDHIKKLSFIYATKFPYNELITDAFNKHVGYERLHYPNEFDCTRNHYSIVKQSLDLGYNKILVIEDDVCLLDTEYFIDIITNIPDDFDILQMCGFSQDINVEKYYKLYNDNNIKFIKNPAITGLWNAGFYMLSKQGMKYYISFINQRFGAADTPFFVLPTIKHNLNYYITSIPLAIQNHSKSLSDIRPLDHDVQYGLTVDYNINYYESQIDKSRYIQYNK
jgi:GR25 family glycosyltransferase involved in LPS biosynthesis